ncbi:hypothetical protein, partial [Escherichia coli]
PSASTTWTCACAAPSSAGVRLAGRDDRLRLEGMARRLRHPGERLRQQAQRLDDLDMRMRRAFERRRSPGWPRRPPAP